MSSYREVVRKLEALGVMPERVPSLEPMRQALEKLGGKALDPERVILIAGTNGKGSVAATLEQLLLSAGLRTGLYTSPHLVETTERIRISGKDVSQSLFVQAFEQTASAGRGLSHFERITLMAIWIFSQLELDWIILEVGLGGRWDATNAIDHRTCVIAPLSLDHQNLLGSTLPEIAANKLDILRDGARVIHAPFAAELGPLVASYRKKFPNTRWHESHGARLKTKPGPHFFAETPWGEAEIALPGQRGAENTALALTVFQSLGFDPSRFLTALAQVRWPGRMQKVALPGIPCPVYVSGDHNPAGVQSLLALLPDYPRKRLHLIFGLGKDKALNETLSPLFTLKDASIYLTETPFRGRALEDYGPWLGRAEASAKNLDQALCEVAKRANSDDLLIITGSLYLVGAALSKI